MLAQVDRNSLLKEADMADEAKKGKSAEAKASTLAEARRMHAAGQISAEALATIESNCK